MSHSVYDSPLWDETRAAVLARDNDRCTVARLIGGDCSDATHVHHIQSVTDRPDLAYDHDNLASVCSRHHPTWEAIRRAVLRARGWRACPHKHVTAEARRLCEERLNRESMTR